MDLAGKLLAELADLSPDQLNTLGEQLQRIGRILITESARLVEPSPNPLSLVVDEEGDEEKEAPVRSVGRFGVITADIALVRAQELGEFTRPQFAEKLGLKVPAANRWLTTLIHNGEIVYINGEYRCLTPPCMRDWVVRQEEPFDLEAAAQSTKLTVEEALEALRDLASRKIVESVDDVLFQYLPPPNTSPRERPHRLPPEKERPSYELAKATGMPVRVAASRKATRAQRSTAGAGGVKGFKQRDKRYDEMQAKKEARAEERKAKAQKAAKWQSRNGKRR